ncbi:MAG: carboxypeptidase regulatory-like domain-containing protein, partial [Bryobacteraceae bacterium]
MAIAGLLFQIASAVAQSTDAALSGTITDPSAAPVPGVKVVAAHIETGVSTTVATNEAGVFVFAALPPGGYRISAEHSGFRKAVVNGVELEIGARLTLNLSLELGAVAESVEVSAEAGEISYSTATVGTVVTGRKILELPLAGRSTYDLLTTQAGVYGANISGNRTGSLNVTTDGINAQDNLLNGLFNISVSNQIRVDRVEEFRIITSPADAELGRGSGQIQVLTRSGTNAFHGSLWEEHRNTVLTANNFFNNARGHDAVTGQPVSPRDVLIRNQYGGRLGGPIRRNRTFFHGNFDGERQRQRNATTTTVLTPTARRGEYRFFPGALNANAIAIVPTVDLQGNPLRPPTATGDLQ